VLRHDDEQPRLAQLDGSAMQCTRRLSRGREVHDEAAAREAPVGARKPRRYTVVGDFGRTSHVTTYMHSTCGAPQPLSIALAAVRQECAIAEVRSAAKSALARQDTKKSALWVQGTRGE